MKIIIKHFFRFLSVVILCLVALSSAQSKATEGVESPVPIRIGWQMPAATQAQILQVLKRTNVLESHGLEPSLVPFSYGGPQAEAAFRGELDAFFAGDQPAINLMARGGKWKIVAKLFEDRVDILVPPKSPIQSVEELKGKTVASPFGSVAHREVFLEQQAAGLDTDLDVQNVNLDVLEISRRVLAGGVETWDGIDAAAVWDPSVSRFQIEGVSRSLASSRYIGVVAVSDDFITHHPQATVQFLVALARAWAYFAQHTDQVMQWYIEDAHLNYSPEALVAARLDPNFSATSIRDIDLTLTEEHIKALEQGEAWRREPGMDGIQMRQFIDQSLLSQAMKEISAREFDDIQVILPSNSEIQAGENSGVYSSLVYAPLWAVFAFMLLIALVAIEFGFRLGRHKRENVTEVMERPIATVVAAVLALMAFVIALTFGSANTRFDDRKAALLEDVTALQSAYLRANLIPEPHRTTVGSLLRDYVQARAGIVYAYGQPDTLRLIQQRAEVLQALMWSHVEALAAENNDGTAYEPFASALNEVFNLHTKRVVLGAYYRIPGFMWLALILASGVAMFAVGFQFGIGGRRIYTANLSLALTFALVMLLAFDLDRAGEGLISVNQQPMIDLYQNMSK